MILDLNGFGSNGSTGPQEVGTSGWVSVALIQLGGAKRGGLLTLTVGANALTHLKLSRAAQAGGTHVDWIVDTAFNTSPNGEMLDAVPATGLSTLGAAGVGQIKLYNLEGVMELQVWAQASVATTLQIDAAFG